MQQFPVIDCKLCFRMALGFEADGMQEGWGEGEKAEGETGRRKRVRAEALEANISGFLITQ